MASLSRLKGWRPYPGDNPIKREARFALYRNVKRHLPAQTDHVVTLAGPDAAEVPYFRDYLQSAPSKTWFVDVDNRGLRVARKEWPGVQTFCGRVACAFESSRIPAIRFAHLDFMGPYGNEATRSVRALSLKIVKNGLIALAFMRGRENHVNTRRAITVAERLKLSGTSVEDRETQRWVGTFLTLQEDLNREISFIDGLVYQHNHSSMGVMLVKVVS